MSRPFLFWSFFLFHPAEKILVNAGDGIRDQHRAHTLFVKLLRAHAADDCIGVALRTHGREATQQQRPADAAALLFVQHACRAEEIRSRRIITGITQDFFAPRGDEARNSRAGKAHVALPCCGKAGVLLHPFHHTKFIRRHCAADLYALIPRARRLRIFRQVV